MVVLSLPQVVTDTRIRRLICPMCTGFLVSMDRSFDISSINFIVLVTFFSPAAALF